MTQKNKRSLAIARRTIRDCLVILSVPWPIPSVSDADQRAAARGLGRSRYLPSPIQDFPFHKHKN